MSMMSMVGNMLTYQYIHNKTITYLALQKILIELDHLDYKILQALVYHNTVHQKWRYNYIQ